MQWVNRNRRNKVDRLSRNSCQPMITQILEVDYTDNTDDAFNLCNRFFNRCNQGRHFCNALYLRYAISFKIIPFNSFIA